MAVGTAAALVIGLAGPAAAAPADYDTGFGNAGVASTAPPTAGAFSTGSVVAVDSTGNVYVGGATGQPTSSTTTFPHTSVALSRFTPAGQPDTTFNSTGTAVTDVSSTGTATDTGVATTTGGAVLVTASALAGPVNSPTSATGYLMRFTSAGVADTTFGTAGQATVTPSPASVAGVATDAAGNALIAGTTSSSITSTTSNAFVERFTPAGQPDTTFGSSGLVTLTGATAHAIAVTSDGHILVAGASPDGLTIFRLTSTGALDTTFGAAAGKEAIGFPSSSGATGILPRSDGSTVIIGALPSGPIALLLNPAGRIDRSFGDGGVTEINIVSGAGIAAGALTPTGDIALAGLGGPTGLWTARLHSNGTVDRTFAPGGKAAPVPPSGTLFLPGRGITAQSDGKVVIAGRQYTQPSSSGPTIHLAAARLVGGAGSANPPANTATRVAGADRIATAVAISAATFDTQAGTDPTKPVTSTVVLASADNYPDALVGTPLAAAAGGPLLLTHPDALDPRVMAEIRRVLGAPASTVGLLVLGGTAAVSDAAVQTITAAGYQVKRIAGSNRYETAVDVANQLKPDVVLEATGTNFPDGVTAGAAAAHLQAAVLLTDGSTQSTPTAGYLSTNKPAAIAVGGGAAAADPNALAIVGVDRYDTAAKVASALFISPSVASVATGAEFADALAGGSRAAVYGSPILLTDPASLTPATATYLQGEAKWIDAADVFGGTLAVSDSTLASIKQAITETTSTAAMAAVPYPWPVVAPRASAILRAYDQEVNTSSLSRYRFAWSTAR